MNAREFALSRHGKQEYGDGHPYIEHLDRVAKYFSLNSVEHDAALLHDILEDTDTHGEEIAEEFGVPVFIVVDLLTKRDGVSGDLYYMRIRDNPFARAVKLADLSDNLAHCLLNLENGVPPKNKEGWMSMANRYAKRIHYLTT